MACTACCRTSPTSGCRARSVLRDFVELPSQLFEHWLSEPAVLKQHARHWQTDAPIPDELIERMQQGAALQPGL